MSSDRRFINISTSILVAINYLPVKQTNFSDVDKLVLALTTCKLLPFVFTIAN